MYLCISKKNGVQIQGIPLVIKDLFGTAGSEFKEIKQETVGEETGEIVIKNPPAKELAMSKKFKKKSVKTIHLK